MKQDIRCLLLLFFFFFFFFWGGAGEGGIITCCIKWTKGLEDCPYQRHGIVQDRVLESVWCQYADHVTRLDPGRLKSTRQLLNLRDEFVVCVNLGSHTIHLEKERSSIQ